MSTVLLIVFTLSFIAFLSQLVNISLNAGLKSKEIHDKACNNFIQTSIYCYSPPVTVSHFTCWSAIWNTHAFSNRDGFCKLTNFFCSSGAPPSQNCVGSHMLMASSHSRSPHRDQQDFTSCTPILILESTARLQILLSQVHRKAGWNKCLH